MIKIFCSINYCSNPKLCCDLFIYSYFGAILSFMNGLIFYMEIQ